MTADLRQKVADALWTVDADVNGTEISEMADAVLAVPEIARALKITAAVDGEMADYERNYPRGDGLTDYGHGGRNAVLGVLGRSDEWRYE